jgi:NADPH:quinone reductase-like Zn-dependent oxidoreductase
MSMRAVVHDRYGAPEEVLEARRIDKPEIGRDEVLVRVHAAGLHVGDCFGVRGSPWPLRMISGLSASVSTSGLAVASNAVIARSASATSAATSPSRRKRRPASRSGTYASYCVGPVSDRSQPRLHQDHP